MAKLEVVGLRVKRKGLPCVVDAVIEGLNLGESIPLKWQLL